jgi:hypothetical protein
MVTHQTSEVKEAARQRLYQEDQRRRADFAFPPHELKTSLYRAIFMTPLASDCRQTTAQFACG